MSSTNELSADTSPVLLQLLKSGDYSDMTLVGEGREFHVHKAVVCSQSPVIAAAFRNDYEEARTNVFRIHEFDDDTVQRMVTFFYTGQYEVETQETSSEVDGAVLPETLKPTAYEAYRDALLSLTSTQNVTETLLVHVQMNAIAEFFDVPKLKKVANARIAAGFKASWIPESFAEVASSVLSSTGDAELHSMLASVAAAHIEELVKTPSFAEMEVVSDFALDVMKKCAQRIRKHKTQETTAQAHGMKSSWKRHHHYHPN